VNTAFTGNTALSLGVNPALLASPSLLSASRTGTSGDGSNLQRLAATRDQTTLAGGSQTVEQYYAAIVGNAGTQVQQVQNQQTAQQALGKQLQAQQQSVSGVNENEELLNMLQFQRGFQLASSYVSAVNQSYDALFNIAF
jgi:flagellar hook-associated protein 1 FlgK